MNSLMRILNSEIFNIIWVGIFVGIGSSASWAFLCFLGRSIRIYRVRASFKNCIQAPSVSGGADYNTGAFRIMIRNKTRWDLVIRHVYLSIHPNSSQGFPLKHDPNEDITKLHRITIPPEWGETWELLLSEEKEPKSGSVKYESKGYFGGCIIRCVHFTPSQIEQIRKLQLGAIAAQKNAQRSKNKDIS